MSDVFYPQKDDFLPSKTLYLLRAGFQGKQPDLDQKMWSLINEIFLEAISLVNAEVTYKTVSIKEANHIQIPEKFKNIKKITFFISTIGYFIEKRISDYSKLEKTTKAVLLDAWGSESIEELNNNFDKRLRKKHKLGTIRFSPGYSDVNIMENNKIIDFLKCDTVKAHPKSGMLSPQKSTVCMIGWY